MQEMGKALTAIFSAKGIVGGIQKALQVGDGAFSVE